MFFEGGADLQKKIGLGKDLVRAVVGPRADEAGATEISEPIGDLLDGCLFEIVWQCGLTCTGRCAGQNVTAGILNPGSVECRVRSAEWGPRALF